MKRIYFCSDWPSKATPHAFDTASCDMNGDINANKLRNTINYFERLMNNPNSPILKKNKIAISFQDFLNFKIKIYFQDLFVQYFVTVPR